MILDATGVPIRRESTQRSSGSRSTAWVGAFQRKGDLVSRASAAALSLTTAMQFSVWVRPFTADLVSVPIVVCKGNVNTAYVMLIASNKVIFRVVIGGVFKDAADPTDVPRNAWTHYRGIYNGANVILQKNDVQVASSAATGSIDTNANPLRFGDADTAQANTFNGLLYDARLWNVASPGDDKSVQLVGSETGLAGNWLLGEGSGTTVDDRGPNALDLTVTNADQWSSITGRPY